MKSFGISGGTRDAVSRCDARSTWNNVGKTCYSKCFTGEPDALKGARRVRIGVRGTPRAYYTTLAWHHAQGIETSAGRHLGGVSGDHDVLRRILQRDQAALELRPEDSGGNL